MLSATLTTIIVAEFAGWREEGNSQEKDSRKVQKVVWGRRVALQDQWLQ
jgi:hypothetical protein